MKMDAPNSLRIAICDDEKEIRNNIERNIRLIYADVSIVQFEDGKTLLAYTEQIDILFLDIQMQPIDGMETARELRKAGSRMTIIFVTAIEEYVFQAFDVGAFHYLVKPIEQVKFFEVLRKAVEEQKSKKRKSLREEPCIAVKKGAMTQKIFLCDISYLEIFNRKVIAHKTDGEIEFYGKLVELEESLGSNFVRCHRAYIVNLRYVLKYDASSITLESGVNIPLAKPKYAEFVKEYMKYTSSLIQR